MIGGSVFFVAEEVAEDEGTQGRGESCVLRFGEII